MSKIQIFICLILIAAIGVLGFFVWKKYESKQIIYSFSAPVTKQDSNKLILNAAFPASENGVVRLKSKEITALISRSTQIVRKSGNTYTAAFLSDIKGTDVSLTGTQVTIFTKDNPQAQSQVAAYRIEITKDFVPIK